MNVSTSRKRTRKQKAANFVIQGSILALAGILVRIIGMLYRMPLNDIFRHCQYRRQHKMLVHHPNPQVYGLFRGFNGRRRTFHENLPFIRLTDAIEDFHQCGFACPVLPQMP